MSTEPDTIRVGDLARERETIYAPGEYDHSRQFLLGATGAPSTTSVKDEDAGGSTTFWDGESA